MYKNKNDFERWQFFFLRLRGTVMQKYQNVHVRVYA